MSVIEFLAVVGIFTIIMLISIFIISATQCFFDFTDRQINKYRYKHRFDKKPTAKCYCIDCDYHDNKFCFYHKENTADEWFCWKAEPKDKIEK